MTLLMADFIPFRVIEQLAIL
ncbi:hypothetical protein BVI1335_870018 [Burkholderia vietnamiensis]|nr:hypothetical protein BVI1335_870018 [Burkholderia vietnamiensis]